MSYLRNGPCHVTNIFPHVDKLHMMSRVYFEKLPCHPRDKDNGLI